MRRILNLSIAIIFLILTFAISEAKNWPQFRGPNSNCLPAVDNIPIEWDSTNIAWKFKLQGRGWSSPILWDNKVFISTSIFVEDLDAEKNKSSSKKDAPKKRTNAPPNAIYRWELYCLDVDSGKELWKQVVHTGRPTINMHPRATYASETPVTDGKRVYVYFGMLGLFCYDFDGNLVWKKDLGTHQMKANWGTGTSPLLYDNMLYMQIDNEDNSFLAALDTKTGEERWRIDREDKSSWSTPIIWKNSKRTELVTLSAKARSYNPKTGKQLWEIDIQGGRSSASATAAGDMIYFGNEERSNVGGSLFAVNAGASGDISLAEGESRNQFVAWMQPESGIAMASPLVYDGLVYIAERKRGKVNCYNAKTGEPVYLNERLPGVKELWVAPWAVNGKIYFLDDRGITHVLESGKEFKLISQNPIDDITWTIPAIGEGVLVIRGVDYVHCVK